MPCLAVSIFVFVIGAMVGSFLNVCIYRMPREESVIWPASHCMNCGKPVKWYDNIPVLSYFFLGGKCRSCEASFSIRYAIVEFINAVAFLLFWIYFGLSWQFFVGITLFAALLVVSVIDFDFQIIPDEISIGGLVIGIVASGFVPAIHAKSIWWQGLLESALGMLAGGGMIYLTGVVGDFVFKKESMGGGDVKLLAMLGTILGWQKVALVYLVAPIFALPFGLFF